MEYDVYIESVFFGLFRNWNLEPCLKVGGIVIFASMLAGKLTIYDEDDRIRTHINSNVYCGVDDIREGIKKYPDNLILNFEEFQNRIGYRITDVTRNLMREKTGSEAMWFLDRKLKVEECII